MGRILSHEVATLPLETDLHTWRVWLDEGPIVRVARYRFGRRWDRVWHPAGAFRAEDVARAVALVEEKERGLLWETPDRTSALEPATPPPLPRRPARAVA